MLHRKARCKCGKSLNTEKRLPALGWDFMTSMTTMGLSQVAIGLAHRVGHTLSLDFDADGMAGGLVMRRVQLEKLHCNGLTIS